MFDRCCNMRSRIHYETIHNPKPISLSAGMEKAVKNLLWYVPNIDSHQSPKIEFIEEKLYDDFTFTYIMNKMGMIEDRDVKWLDRNEEFSEEDWQYYESDICDNCQKAIISRCKKLTKTNDLLRCVRNCIAHGHFAIVNDYIIGFNMQVTEKNPEGKKKAIIKIKPKLLLKALESLSSPSAKEQLIGYAFGRMGYEVLDQHTSIEKPESDLMIKKGIRIYSIEVLDFKGKPYLHEEDLAEYFIRNNQRFDGINRVLFIDTSRVINAVREKEKETNGFRIIDVSQVKEMLKDNPIDILAE